MTNLTKEQHEPILLVDDNSNDVELTLWTFAKLGITDILVVRDGVEALDLLLPFGERAPLHPPLVLLDVNMPCLDGPETLRQLRADPRTEALPVIMLTSFFRDRDLVDSGDGNATGYVAKPIEIDEFLSAVRQLGLYGLGLPEPATPAAA